MLKHFLIISWRNILRHKFYSFLLVAGFAIGLASAIMLILFTLDELSYDRFHEKKDRIYLVGVDQRRGLDEYVSGWTSPPTGPAMEDFFPEVDKQVRVCFWTRDEVLVNVDEKKYVQEGILTTEPAFFDLFSVKMLKGNPKTALKEPHSVVLTESLAKKYFGDEDPMGKTIRIYNILWESTVTGVVEDFPKNSHIQFEMLASMSSFRFNMTDSWGNHTFSTYLLLHENASQAQVEAKMPDFVKAGYGAHMAQGMGISVDQLVDQLDGHYKHFLVPLVDAHHSALIFDKVDSKKVLTYAMGGLALIILLLVCINFVNLATALSMRRAKEIGIRKASGSSKKALVFQFLIESNLIVWLGGLMAVWLVKLGLPFYNAVLGKELVLTLSDPATLAILAGLLFLIGLLSGLYPAFVLTSFNPIQALKGTHSFGRGSGMRKALVVVQFSLCIFMLICTAVVYDQLQFMSDKALGFDNEQVLVVKRKGLGKKNAAFKEEVLKLPGVQHVTFTNTIPGRHFSGNGQNFVGIDGTYTIYPLIGDEDVLKTLDIPLASGRTFGPQDKNQTVALLNRAAVKKYGFKDPLKMTFSGGTMGKEKVNVIGLVEDIHFKSFHQTIEPMVVFKYGGDLNAFNSDYILFKLTDQAAANTLTGIKNVWKDFSDYPYRSFFLDEDMQHLFERERMSAKIYTFFSLISIFIACLGLLGLASFAAEKRKKEIGIRKVNGAKVSEVVLLLNKDFVKWVIFAFFFAAPLAWLTMNSWIQNFAYRVELNLLWFILAGLIALTISLVTVSWQSWKAAMENPVEALRTE